MTEVQIISRILKEKNLNLISLNGITSEWFVNYKEEFNFIQNHFNNYGNVPDKETFLAKFTDFDIIDVTESDKYLIETFAEEHLYSQTVPVVNKIADLMQTDSYAAINYLQGQLPNLIKQQSVVGLDIISDAQKRLDEYNERKSKPNEYLIPTGFQAIDEVIGGFQTGEEFAVLFARTGNGKSWVLIKMLEHAWKMNKRVGLVEPEMSANKTGYRFDTLHNHVSNTALTKGMDVDGDYEGYIKNLATSNIPFFVAHPKEFQRKITVSKLRAFVEANKLDVLAIDGISYLTDERAVKGDNRTIQLTNISEDLMDLSIDLGIPVIVVAQSNREGAKQEELELENIRDSDGIAYNASLIFSVTQKDPGLQIAIKKNRNGKNNVKFTYLWDIDIGKFEYVPSEENDVKETEKVRQKYNDTEEVF